MTKKRLMLFVLIGLFVIIAFSTAYVLLTTDNQNEISFEDKIESGKTMMTEYSDTNYTKTVHCIETDGCKITGIILRNKTNGTISVLIEKNGIEYKYNNIIEIRNQKYYINADKLFNLIEDNKFRIFGAEKYAGMYVSIPEMPDTQNDAKKLLVDSINKHYKALSKESASMNDVSFYKISTDELLKALSGIKDEIESQRLAFVAGVNEKKELIVYSEFGDSLLKIIRMLFPDSEGGLMLPENEFVNYGQQVFDYVGSVLDSYMAFIKSKDGILCVENADYTLSDNNKRSFAYSIDLCDETSSYFRYYITCIDVDEDSKNQINLGELKVIPFTSFIQNVSSDLVLSEHYCYDSADFPYTYNLYNNGKSIVFVTENAWYKEQVSYLFDESGLYRIVVEYETRNYSIHEALVNYYSQKYYTVSENNKQGFASGEGGILICYTESLFEISNDLYSIKTPEELYNVMSLRLMPLYAE